MSETDPLEEVAAGDGVRRREDDCIFRVRLIYTLLKKFWQCLTTFRLFFEEARIDHPPPAMSERDPPEPTSPFPRTRPSGDNREEATTWVQRGHAHFFFYAKTLYRLKGKLS